MEIFYIKNIFFLKSKCICHNSTYNYKSISQEGFLEADGLIRNLKCGKDLSDRQEARQIL